METAELDRTTVAKPKKPKAPAKTDDAEKPFLLKLPGEYRDALLVAKDMTGREMTVSGQIALEMYFRAIGVPFKPNWSKIIPPGGTDSPSSPH
jgi:hypothetical protein